MDPIASRRAILALVVKYPGLHVRELARQADVSEALASYHLQLLLEAELVEAVDDANTRRFYPRQGTSPQEEDRDLMSWLRRPIPLQIALVLLEKGSASHQELTGHLGLAKSTVSYHLAQLENAGFIRRDDSLAVSLVDPRRVARLLVRWEPPKTVVARFGDLWNRFYARRGRR